MSTSVDDETILEVLRSNEAPRMTTTEVAGHLPVTRGTTRNRLQRLVDEGLLERTTEGNNVVWWLPEREDELDAGAEEPGEPEEAVAGEEPEPEPEPTADSETGSEPSDAETDDTEVEAAGAESGPSEVEVEAVDGETDESDAEAADGASETETETETETRTAAERPDLSDDEEGLRAVALVAAVVVGLLLLRKLLGGDGEE